MEGKVSKHPHSDRRRRKMTVIFRVTPEEHARLAEEAANAGVGNINAWAREVTFEAAGCPQMDRQDLTVIIGHLGKIGSNINQIAKIANTNRRVDLAAELLAELEDLLALKRRIASALK